MIDTQSYSFKNILSHVSAIIITLAIINIKNSVIKSCLMLFRIKQLVHFSELSWKLKICSMFLFYDMTSLIKSSILLLFFFCSLWKQFWLSSQKYEMKQHALTSVIKLQRNYFLKLCLINEYLSDACFMILSHAMLKVNLLRLCI